MQKLIAKTIKGREFLHSNEAFFVNAAADKICKLLNDNNYMLNVNNNEIWHVYDYDITQEFYVSKKMYFSKGKVKVTYI